MIATVTFNPAVDYVARVPVMESGAVNRTESEQIFFGGKGINVSLILNTLGISSRALGFVAGFTGTAIESAVRAQGIETDFIHLKSGFSRINVKIKSDKETELNGQGPQIDAASLEALFAQLNVLGSGDTLVLAGSIPNTLPKDIYERILATLQDKQVRFVVDATGTLLVNVLKYKPFLIKPNHHELGEIFGRTLQTMDEIVECARELQQRGAINVLVSMAGDGSVLVDEFGQTHRMGVPKGTVVNSVGAGDSMVAGFLAGYLQRHDYEYALKLGTACGSATAFSEGLAEKATIMNLLKKL